MQSLCQQGAAMRSQRRAVTLCQATGTSLRRPQRRHSRGGGSMGRMWGAAAPTRLLLLLLVLCARDAWAMPRRALGAGDDALGSASPAPQLGPGVELQGQPSGKLSPSPASKAAALVRGRVEVLRRQTTPFRGVVRSLGGLPEGSSGSPPHLCWPPSVPAGRAVPAAPWNPAPETGWHPTGTWATVWLLLSLGFVGGFLRQLSSAAASPWPVGSSPQEAGTSVFPPARPAPGPCAVPRPLCQPPQGAGAEGAPSTHWQRFCSVPVGDLSGTSEHGPVLVPQGDPPSVAVGDGSPASALGPRRARHQARRGQSSQRTSAILQEILQELEGAQGADGEAVQKEALPRGNTLPGSEGAPEAAPATVPPVLSEPGEARHTGVFQFFQENPGAAGERSASASAGAAVRKHCLVSAAAIVGSLLFGTLLCCGVIRLRRRRQQRLSAASEARAPRRAQRQRPPPGPGRAHPSRLQRDRPSALQPPWIPPPRPPPPSRPSCQGWGRPPRRAGQRGGEDWQPAGSLSE
eukprot:XP_027323442.1 translation initiation factor IF-2-like isoform X1 [Anas platyrhynchos]